MTRTTLRIVGGAAAFGLALIFASGASAQERVRVRGVIASIAPSAMTVTPKSGSPDVPIQFLKEPLIAAIVPATLADVKPGAYVGVTSVTRKDVSIAIEIHIIPETQRGSGEGDQPWDLMPDSSMTNGTAGAQVAGNDGRSITVSYPGGERKILITPDTQIVAMTVGNRDELRPGAGVIVFGLHQADGSTSAGAIVVGRNGLMPPM